jgi:cysteine desulfurase
MTECLGLQGAFGNPGSTSHAFGEHAHGLVEQARAQVAAAVGAAPGEVVWTSGATEANNLAIFGVANYYRGQGRHLVTAKTEHKAVLDGRIRADAVAAALAPDTVLVSIMHVNNEIGVVQDIAAIAAVCARHGGTRLHVDAAQSLGKSTVDFTGWGVDLMSLSAHKVYGPKGVGALLVSQRRGVHLEALQFGGGQERNLRSGTLPTHQLVGMGAAFELATADPIAAAAERSRIAQLRERLWQGILAFGGVLRNGAPEHAVPHLLNVSFEGVEGESLLAAVRADLAVSTGSACASASNEASYVLRSLGRNERLAESSLRFSLGRYTADADIDRAIAVLGAALTRLRRIAGQSQ